MIKKEDFLHFVIVLLCAAIIICFMSIILEFIFAFFSWQPIAGRVLIYGLLALLTFHEGYDNIDVKEIDDDDE